MTMVDLNRREHIDINNARIEAAMKEIHNLTRFSAEFVNNYTALTKILLDIEPEVLTYKSLLQRD